MNRSRKFSRCSLIAGLALAIGLLLPATTPQAQSGGTPGVIPPTARPHYAQLSARWWQWSLPLPIAGHPFIGCPAPPDAGQAGPVWFLAGQFGTVECPLTIHTGKTLFLPLANAECSSLEEPPFYGGTAAEQRACAKFWADQIDPSSLFCEVDGVPVTNLERYRFGSPQFAFTAPTPWIFGAAGGTGTAVADGYYLWLAPLAPGAHTLHFGSTTFGIDSTYHLTIAP